jgi:hypothetical protein
MKANTLDVQQREMSKKTSGIRSNKRNIHHFDAYKYAIRWSNTEAFTYYQIEASIIIPCH